MRKFLVFLIFYTVVLPLARQPRDLPALDLVLSPGSIIFEQNVTRLAQKEGFQLLPNLSRCPEQIEHFRIEGGVFVSAYQTSKKTDFGLMGEKSGSVNQAEANIMLYFKDKSGVCREEHWILTEFGKNTYISSTQLEESLAQELLSKLNGLAP